MSRISANTKANLPKFDKKIKEKQEMNKKAEELGYCLFDKANPEDESYWWVLDEDGTATVVYLEYLPSGEVKASYTGVEGFYDAKELKYLGKAVKLKLFEKEKTPFIIENDMSYQDVQNEVLTGEHFQNQITKVLDGTDNKEKEMAVFEALTKIIPVGMDTNDAISLLEGMFDRALNYLKSGSYQVICESTRVEDDVETEVERANTKTSTT